MGDLISGSLGVAFFIVFFVVVLIISRYRRCPSNKILVIYGKVGKGKSAKCIHGGGVIVLPLVQASQYLSLQPMTIDIELNGALSKQNIRINTPSTFTIGVSTNPSIMLNAAERLLGLSEDQIIRQAEDIILGQLRLVIATLTIEQINQDRELFLQQINENVATELNKIGLQLINVNIKDITDASNYIEAIGRKSAAEAINKAEVEVAQQERDGSIGVAAANREKDIRVEVERTKTEEGRKEAEKNRRITIAKLEADAVKEENKSKAEKADYDATLAEKQAEADRRGHVANANANREILIAQRETELSRLEKEEVVREEVEKRKLEIEAEAEAEKERRIAKGKADATLMKYQAEAQGSQELLRAKANGYQQLIQACGDDKQVAATLLLLEKMETLVEKQVEAISNLKIDKITVWDSGTAGEQGTSTAHFLRNMVTSIPPLHEIAKQAGIELPDYLGSLKQKQSVMVHDEEVVVDHHDE